MNTKSLIPNTSGLIETGTAIGAGMVAIYADNYAKNKLPKVKTFTDTTLGQVVTIVASAYGHTVFIKGKENSKSPISKAANTFGVYATFALALTAVRKLMNTSGMEIEASADAGAATGLGNAISRTLAMGLKEPSFNVALNGPRSRNRKKGLRGLAMAVKQAVPTTPYMEKKKLPDFRLAN